MSVFNPLTNRWIQSGGVTHRKLMREGILDQFGGDPVSFADESAARQVYFSAVQTYNKTSYREIPELEKKIQQSKSAREKASLGKQLDDARKRQQIAGKEMDALKAVCRSC